MDIKVLGTGCVNCATTLKLIEEAANSKGIKITLSKVEELPEIMAYGVMSTPGVVIDEKVVHSGGIPEKDVIDAWLDGATDSVSEEGTGGGCCGSCS